MKIKNIFKNKKLNIISLLIAAIILIIVTILLAMPNKLININIFNKKAEGAELLSYVVYDNKNLNQIKTLIRITSERGIEYIEDVSQNLKINGNEKTQIGIDREFRINETKVFNIKEVGKAVKQETIVMNEENMNRVSIGINPIVEVDGFRTVSIDNNIDLPGYKAYHKIGTNGQWVEGTGKVTVIDYDLINEGLNNANGPITIEAKIENPTNGNRVYTSKKYEIHQAQGTQTVTANSILEALEDDITETGIYKVNANGESYNLSVRSYQGDLLIAGNTTIGSKVDVASPSKEYAENTVVLKVDGNLTIDSGATLTAYSDKDGYGGPKGMLIYCTGTLTNNGTISMTAKGARAVGQDVYLWENADGTYEYIPSEGAPGGVAANGGDLNGNNGRAGAIRQTGRRRLRRSS